MKPDPTPRSDQPPPAVPDAARLAQATAAAPPTAELPAAGPEDQHKLRQTEDALRFLVQCGYAPSGEDFFRALARYLAQSLGADFVCIDRLHEGSLAAETVAVFLDGKFQDNLTYTLKDTPCGDVVGKTVCCFPRDVRRLFPKDVVLQQMGAEGYLGTTLWSAQGQPIGLIALIWRRPLADTQLATSILQLVAVRAAGELERRQAEAALQDNVRLLNDIIDGCSPSAIFLKDRDGKFITINAPLEKMLGMSREELKGKTDYDLFPKEVADLYRAHDTKVMATGEALQVEEAADLPDGHHFFLANKFPLVDANSRLYGVGAISHDITERKRAEEALRATAQRFYSVLDSMYGSILLVNDEGKGEFANQSFCDLFNLKCSPKDLIGLAANDIIGRIKSGYAQPEEALRRIREMVTLGKPVKGEEVAMANGCTCLRDFIPIDLEGKSYGRLWHHIDITKRKRAEKERDRVFEYSLDMLCVAGFDGYFKRVSPSFEKTLGWSEAELLSKPFFDFMHPDDREETLQGIKAHERGTQTIQLENRYRCKDGSYKWIAWNAHAMAEEQLVVAVARDITERRRSEEALRLRAEEALRMSEEEFRSLAEAVPQIVWATRPDGWNIFFNQQWVDYTGMTMEESYGHGWNTPFHPEDKQRAWEAWQHATQYNERYSLECRLRRADGVYRWWLIRGRPMLGANGEILKWFGTCTDIEDIKRAEVALQQAHDTLEQRVAERTAQLQQSEALLRTITDNSPDPIFLKDRASRMLLANPATLAALQRRAEDVLGKTDEEFYDDPAMGRLMMANDQRVMESGKTEVMEEVVPSPGGPRTFLSAKTPYRDAEGHVIGLIGIARDITERKQGEEALAQQREELQLILDSAPAMIFYKDRENHFLRVNRAFAESMGAPKEQLEGRSLFELYPREQAEAFWRDDQEVLVSGRPKANIVEPMRTAAGERWVQTGKVPCRDAQGNLTGVIGFALDITERKRAEDALRATNEELNRFNQAMVGRELRMIELKQEINDLCGKLGQPPRYSPEPAAQARPAQ